MIGPTIMLHIEYQISEDDYVAAAKLALRKLWRDGPFMAYGFPAIGILFILASVFGAITKPIPWDLLGLISGVFLASFPFRQKLAARRQYRRTPALHAPRCLEIDDVEFHFISPDFDDRNTWNIYCAFAEDAKSFVLVRQGNDQFVPIPKRLLDPVQIDTLRALLMAHLPQK
jgi:hypothetical protein